MPRLNYLTSRLLLGRTVGVGWFLPTQPICAKNLIPNLQTFRYVGKNHPTTAATPEFPASPILERHIAYSRRKPR